MKFFELAELFKELEKTQSRLEMTCLIAGFVKRASVKGIDKAVYLMQGKLGPDFDRPDIGMGEKLVVKALSYTTGFSVKEVTDLFAEKGDLGIVAELLSKKKKQHSLFNAELSVEKVFENLYRIALIEGRGAIDLKIKLLSELFNSAKPVEARFLARLPLDKLRLGVGDPTLMDAIAVAWLKDFRKKNALLEKEIKKKFRKLEDIERQLKFKLREFIESKFNVCPDMGRIIVLIKEKGLTGLNEISIKLGVPVRPTLAERLESPEKIIEKIGACLVEAKYDGLRVQIHRDNNKVFIYSRQMEKVTEMMPDVVRTVLCSVKPKKAILEAEIMAVNPKTGKHLPFQKTVQRKRKYGVKEFAEKYPLKLYVFDVLYAGNKSFLEVPFRERRKKLEEIIVSGKFISLTKAVFAETPEQIKDFFGLALKEDLEGIIAKDLNEKYIAGARKFAWIKLKKSYETGKALDTLDCVIIGYYQGKGKRTRFGLGALLAAVYNTETGFFESIAKIGSGMTEEQLVFLEEQLSKLKLREKPKNVLSELKPDFWVEPKIVVEVNYDEITKSPVHLAAKTLIGEGLALRFPRMLRIRQDKSVEGVTTTNELLSLYEKQS